MDDERIEVRWFPPPTHAMILAGKIDDAKTITGFFLWKARPGGAATRTPLHLNGAKGPRVAQPQPHAHAGGNSVVFRYNSVE